METSSRWLLIFLGNALWQATVITIVAMLCDRLMRKAPARQRHWLWVATLALSVMIPLLSAFDFLRDDARGAASREMISIRVEADNRASTSTSSTLGGVFRPRPRTFSPPPVLITLVLTAYWISLLFHGAGLWCAWRKTKATIAAAYKSGIPERPASIKLQCQKAFGLSDVSLLGSVEVACPIAAGTRSIILPASLLDSDAPDVLTAAIGHEMAHLKRRDFTLNLIYELLSLPLSFHPAIIFIKRRIKETRELACDELVAEQLLDAPVYARSLLTLADSVMNFRRSTYTPGVFDADILEERIMKLIERKPGMSRPASIAILAAVSLALAVSGAVAAAFALNIEQQPREARSIAGDWELFLTEEGRDPKGSVFEFPVGLSLRLEGNKPAGTMHFPIMVATDRGPEQKGVSDAPLLDPRFDGRQLSFRVAAEDKEDFLEMRLHLAGDNFAGRWKVLRSGEGGSVKMSRKQDAKPSLIEKIVGEWSVALFSSDGTAADGMRPLLIVKANGDQLTAKTIFNFAGEKKEWKLIEPKFDGDVFLFKVDNGEEVLEGRLKLVNDHFEGPWKASQSGASGTMKLTRKK